ncbi:MAG: alpha/beta hydrolase [Acidimicrobiales bacterium]|nr:alpha/beta hydrolase [Acidimicrobiales bacterium]
MSGWSKALIASLDKRATVISTKYGLVQVPKEGAVPQVSSIHGSPGGFDQGLLWAEHLQAGGCEIIAPSRPGYLRTPLDSGESPAQRADLYAAMLDVLLIEKVTVLGISSGGPSAVHFAARHPDRTVALLLDAAVLLPITPDNNWIERTIVESNAGTWASCQIAKRWPKLSTALLVDALSSGLTRTSRKAAVDWITSHPARLKSAAGLTSSLAPRKFRHSGHKNDEGNEINLDPLPFADIKAPTLISQGANDAFPLIEHAVSALGQIVGAEFILVEEGHHGLPWCRRFAEVAERQIFLTHN